MPKMNILIEVDISKSGTTTTDPHDIAANIIAEYNDSRYTSGLGLPQATFLEAEWVN